MFTNKWMLMIGISSLIIVFTACSNGANENNLSGENSTEQETTPGESNESVDRNNGSENNTNEDSHDKIEINKDESITALVNKYNSFGENYEPDDLVTVEVPTVLDNPEINQLRQVAADALRDMFAEAKEAGIILYARSGYRSYQTQVQLFNNYAAEHGKEAANRYSAKPGHSEHQTGLVMDVTSESVDLQLKDRFGETEAGKWLSEHAHEFGFIIRYPKDMEQITGYVYEPWHIRYLGLDVATEVYESGLTYEQYLVEEGIIHEVNAEAVE